MLNNYPLTHIQTYIQPADAIFVGKKEFLIN
uniref:Uncharacterized protein n=1 Tax=Anguilla anguilla TaxID=7936 RepID=A0A0E9Y2U4_ANGAN